MSEPTPEAIEAAAEAIHMSGTDETHWDDLSGPRKRFRMKQAEAALSAAAPYLIREAQVAVVHCGDGESHARSFNEGYEAAVTQGLADDPALADDWLQDRLREAQAQALEQVAEDWEALVRREKPPIRGYIFLRSRAAAIRDSVA